MGRDRFGGGELGVGVGELSAVVAVGVTQFVVGVLLTEPGVIEGVGEGRGCGSAGQGVVQVPQVVGCLLYTSRCV